MSGTARAGAKRTRASGLARVGKDADRYDRLLYVIGVGGSISRGGKFILRLSPPQPTRRQQQDQQPRNKRSVDKDWKIS